MNARIFPNIYWKSNYFSAIIVFKSSKNVCVHIVSNIINQVLHLYIREENLRTANK